MSECQHKSIIGDNYGDSCGQCGKQLSGYGWGGWFGSNLTGNEVCIHVYDRSGICAYCQGLKPSNLESNQTGE